MEKWGLGRLVGTAELVLSELLTNSLRHARIPRYRLIETRFERLAGGVRIEVHDADGTLPTMRASAGDAESGRGPALVDAVTAGRWGACERESGGKLVRAMVTDGEE
ncbi:ATP-binding protein [Streptomyces sp. AM 4-1-1]|uniref:ATP-binding protein n=1 Tax=Streptomyces sp. AM 4-1-1 TaxID=3028710 RepID=UPI0023B8FDE6|nr:ATP-binding protein [Streptomyces sp. AM 4-1-1]WEH35487.1 ATP-binding protein [Streptomyces sp. AM 4-1-1]